MEQGPDLYENQELPVTSGEVDYILLTHAHIDHSGNIPLLVKRDFPERSLQHLQRQICAISCCVTAHIQEFEAEMEKPEGKTKRGTGIRTDLYGCRCGCGDQTSGTCGLRSEDYIV